MVRAARAWSRFSAASLLVAGLMGGCGDGNSRPTVGSNSNWLRACDADAQCGESTSCLCGACSAQCSTDADCGELEDGQCVMAPTAAAQSQCATETSAISSGICLPKCTPGTCQDGQACIAGSCVIHELPTVELCAPVADRPQEDRVAEESLLGLVQQMRTQGGVECQPGQLTTAGAEFRIDPRLTCAARVLAVDSDAGTASEVQDSQGRTGGERLQLAGYDVGAWGEMVAIGAPSADSALSLLLSDAQSCRELANTQYAAIGVGHAGSAYVITLAGP